MPFTTSKNVRNLLNKFNPMYRKNHRELEEMSKEDLINYVEKLHVEIRTTQVVYYHSGVHEGKRCFAADLWAHKQGILAFDTERKYSTNKGPNWDKRKELGWEAQLEEKCIKHSNQSVDETSGITIFNILQEENKKLKEENEKVNNDLFERTSFESYFLQNEEDKDFIDYIEFLEFRKDDEKECLDRATERYKSLMITLKENRKLKEELKLKDEIIRLHETS